LKILFASSLVMMSAPAMAQTAAIAEIKAAETADPLENAKPLHYALTIEPDLEQFSFDGQSVIDVDLPNETQTLSLNAKSLTFQKAELFDGNSVIPLSIKLDAVAEQVHFAAGAPIKPGKHRLQINYRGIINETSNGLFAVDTRGSSYDANNPKQAGANNLQFFTHAQPNFARTIFPTWDTPGYKMTFDLALDLPAGLVSVSNMPEKGVEALPSGKVRTTFKTTPLMSSYLLFFAIGDFERKAKAVGGIDYGIVVRRNEPGDYNYALNSMPTITAKFAEYYGIPYTLPKLDFVLSAKKFNDFIAMENWGAMLGSENTAKFDRYMGGGDTTGQTYFILTHEIAHQWLGNLVTPKNWDDLWLSEGLATHMTNKVMDKQFPIFRISQQAISDQNTIKSIEATAKTSALSSSQSVKYSSDEVTSTMVYIKGGAVIDMIEQAVGAPKWQAIMQRYLADNRFAAVTKETLADTMIAMGEADAVKSFRDFATQAGFPLITVDAARCINGQMTISYSQKPYPGISAPIGSLWHVPIHARVAGAAAQQHYLSSATGEFQLPSCKAFTLNAKGVGYYRVDYSKVAGSENFVDFKSLFPDEQYGVLLDSFANANEAGATLTTAMNYLKETDLVQSPEALTLAIEKYDRLLKSYSNAADAPTRTMVAALIRKRLGPVLEKIGYNDVGYGRDDPLRWTRASLLELLDRADYAPLLAQPENALPNEDRSLFLSFSANASAWSRIAFRNLSLAQWQQAMKGKTKNSIGGISEFLGVNKKTSVANAALNLAATGNWESYTRFAIISSVAMEHPDLAMKFLLGTPGLKTKMTSDLYFDTALDIGKKSSSLASANILKAQFSGKLSAAQQKQLDDVLKGIKARSAEQTKIRAELTNWIKQQ
jgi:aminopeptidase N